MSTYRKHKLGVIKSTCIFAILASDVFSSAWAVDSDLDTLPDDWEIANGRDPNVPDYMVSAGNRHTCAIDDTGVVCWGADDFGQSTPPNHLFVNPIQVDANFNNTCVLDDQGTQNQVYCWGWTSSGINDINRPVFLGGPVIALTDPSYISVGELQACAVDGGDLKCWGVNGGASLGSSGVTKVSAGSQYRRCFLTNLGTLSCVFQIPQLVNAVDVSSRYYHGCGIDDTGIVCWSDGQSEDVYGNVTDIPAWLDNPLSVSAGRFHTCAVYDLQGIGEDLSMACWGAGTALPQTSNDTIGQVSAGNSITCILTRNRGVACKGRSPNVVLGQDIVPELMIDPDGDGVSSQFGEDAFPLDNSEWTDTDSDAIGNNADIDDDGDGVPDVDDAYPLDLHRWSSVGLEDKDFDALPDALEVQVGRDSTKPDYLLASGQSHSCVSDDSGLVCWGDNRWGQSSPPEQNYPSVREIALGSDHSCVLYGETANEISCWGLNVYGQLDVPNLSDPSRIDSGNLFSCATDASGVVCWGIAANGVLLPPSVSDASDLALAAYHGCVLHADGVSCWGDNTWGQLDVPVLSNPTDIESSPGSSHTCAIDDSGLSCWGKDDNGQVSDIPLLTNPVAIAVGTRHSCALDDPRDDTVNLQLYCWGQLGAELVLPEGAEARQISTGNDFSCGLTTDLGVICTGFESTSLFEKTTVPPLTFDPDGDGYIGDENDAFPNDPSEWSDTDGDGFGDNADDFPNNPAEWVDSDGDGVGNNSDPDIDGDGIPNEQDDFPFGRFDDARPDNWAFSFIERLARAGITSGCGNDNYCPTALVTRAQMAVFLERGMNGASFSPPAASGTVFLDVGAGDFAASFIEQLYADGITSGCGSNNYCPEAEVTRAQMAVFLMRAKYGASYTPPTATGIFDDVDSSYWAVRWIEALAADGITSGCGNGNYCPDAPVTRAQMAVFLVRTFSLPNGTPGPMHTWSAPGLSDSATGCTNFEIGSTSGTDFALNADGSRGFLDVGRNDGWNGSGSYPVNVNISADNASAYCSAWDTSGLNNISGSMDITESIDPNSGVRTYSGTWTTTGGQWICSDENSSPVASPFGLPVQGVFSNVGLNGTPGACNN